MPTPDSAEDLRYFGAWMTRQPSLIDKRKRQTHSIVAQRTALADALARYLNTLGLGRVAPQAPRLSE